MISDFAYDSLGELTSQTDHVSSSAADNRTTTYDYDLDGRKILESRPDPDGSTGGNHTLDTRYGYDAAGNLVYTIDPIGCSQLVDHNPSTLQAVADSNHHATTYEYDALNHLVAQRDPDANFTDAQHGSASIPITTYAYDASGNVSAQLDPAGNQTNYTYDQRNRETGDSTQAYLSPSHTDEQVGRSYEYDAAGNLTKVVDANGGVRTFKYDHLNRQTRETWDSDPDSTSARHFDYTYDANGNQLTANDSAGPDFTYTYDPMGRVRTEDRTSPSGTPALPHILNTSAYDLNSNRTSFTQATIGTTNASTTDTYHYNYLDQNDTIASTGGSSKEIDQTFNLQNQPATVTRKDGSDVAVVTNYGYDNAGRLKTLSHLPNGSTSNAINYVYARDANDRITTMSINNVAHVYTYDADGQLTGDNATSQSFTYDLNGNRATRNSDTSSTGKDNRLANDGTSTYVYDKSGNRRLKFKGDIQFNINTNAYQATANGAAAVTYAYDPRNRLIGVTSESKQADGDVLTTNVVYTYDVNDHRIGRTVTTNDSNVDAVDETYANDGDDLTTVFNSSNVITDRYLHDDDGLALSQDNSNGLSWELFDHEGSVRNTLSATGSTVTHTYNYDAYGNITSTDQPERFAYANYVWYPEIGQYGTEGIRVVDAPTGTFDQPDPIGSAGSGTNLSRYVNNDPVTSSDLSGLFASEIYGATNGGAVTGPSINYAPAIDNSYTSHLFPDQFYGLSGSNGGATAGLSLASQFAIAADEMVNDMPQTPASEVSYFTNSLTSMTAEPMRNYPQASDMGFWQNFVNAADERRAKFISTETPRNIKNAISDTAMLALVTEGYNVGLVSPETFEENSSLYNAFAN